MGRFHCYCHCILMIQLKLAFLVIDFDCTEQIQDCHYINMAIRIENRTCRKDIPITGKQWNLDKMGPILANFLVLGANIPLPGGGLPDCPSTAEWGTCPVRMAAPVLDSWIGFGPKTCYGFTPLTIIMLQQSVSQRSTGSLYPRHFCDIVLVDT